jgi:hypothetical protein
MGVRINMFADHDVRPFHDVALVLARLELARDAALAVRGYWRVASPDGRHDVTTWVPDPEFTKPIVGYRCGYYRGFEGPGHLYVQVSDQIVRVFTGGRWRGFLTIEPLRSVHLAAFRAIAAATGGSTLTICRDDDQVLDAFGLRATVHECQGLMRQMWGEPLDPSQPLDPQRVAQSNYPRGIWFNEAVPHSGQRSGVERMS